jgi:hypothetical protein
VLSARKMLLKHHVGLVGGDERLREDITDPASEYLFRTGLPGTQSRQEALPSALLSSTVLDEGQAERQEGSVPS